MAQSSPFIALLVLIGGRQVPNVLTAQFLRPEIIVPIASTEALQKDEAWERVRPALLELCPQGLQEPREVGAFDLAAVRAACMSAIAQYPQAHWVFNITCSTTVMSIGAYEVGRDHGADVWYLDTRAAQVIPLVGRPPDGNPYVITVHDYLRVYNRTAHPAPSPAEAHVILAGDLAKEPDEAIAFRERLRACGASAHYEAPRVLRLRNLSSQMVEWCAQATRAGFVDRLQLTPSGCDLYQVDGYFWKFIDGDWLEIFAWDAARRANCFHDYCFNVRIPTLKPAVAKNEIDLAATSFASLLIAECKTEDRPFLTSHLDQLRAVTSMIGGSFVGAFFITARSEKALERVEGRRAAFAQFLSQAHARQIVVVTGEKLGDLSATLAREARQPTFFRG